MSTGRKYGFLGELTGCPLDFLYHREIHSSRHTWHPVGAGSTFLARRLDSAKGLHHKNLFAHYGCVNAIEFSSEGDYLVSGGDDRRVLLWDVDITFSGKRNPRVMKAEHSSNIFSLGFDASNKKVFSAGNDGKVIVHDLNTGEALDMFLHQLAVYGVCVHPTIDSLFTSAGEDGQVLLYDTRASSFSEPLCLARSSDAYHAVQFHPIEPLFIVTANSRNGVALRDVRKPTVPVIRYGDKKWAQSSMSARFNTTGSQILALRRRLPPVLYDTFSSTPKCQFDEDHYYNSCTLKTCCFAGDKDQFILSGSDDFNLYMWKIPSPHSQVNLVSSAHMVLRGHRSIVNQVRFNSQNFMIASSGVEKVIKLWSGFELPGSNDNHKAMNRKVFTHEEYISLIMENGQSVNHDYSNGSTEEDPRMMAFFDSLVQREVEGYTSNTDLSSDDEDTTRGSVVEEEDLEAVTTQSSSTTVTSQSDEELTGDSDDSEVEQTTSRVLRSMGQTTDSTSARQRASRRTRRRKTSARHRLLVSDEEEEEADNDDSSSKSSGRDWILKLIAKKRAQLKAAKRARRKHRLLRKRQKLRSFMCNAQYFYQPQDMRTSRSNGDSWILPVINDSNNGASSTTCTRNRGTLYPYTVLLVNNSEDNDTPEEEGANSRAPLPNTSSKKRTLSQLNGGSLWSSDGSSSSDETSDYQTRKTKHRRNFVLESDDNEGSDSNNINESSDHIISEVIDTEDSDNNNRSDSVSAVSDTNNEQLQSTSSSSGLYSLIGNSAKTRHNNNSDLCSSNSTGSSDSHCINNITNSFNSAISDHNNQDYNVEIDGNINDIVPITALTTDDNGAVLFDLDQNSLSSGLNLNPNMDVYLPSTPNGKVQSGSCDNRDNTDKNAECKSESSTPDSGIATLPSSTEKSEDDAMCDSSSSTLQTDVDNSSPKVTFSFKKIMRKCALKNYRFHTNDDEDV